MKLRYLMAIACLAAIAGCKAELCQTETVVPASSDAVELTLTAGRESGPEGKAVLDFPSLLWEDSDRIAVFDGTAKSSFSIPEGGNSGTSAVFRGTVSEGASTLYAASPEQAAEACTDGLLTIVIPSVQQIPSGRSAAPEALVAVARAVDGNLAFRNVPALLKISISSDDITAVRIHGTSISGTAKVQPDGTLAQLVSPRDEVTLIPDGATFAPGDYFAAVMPGSTPAGSFAISLIRSDGLSCTRTSSSVQTFARNSCKAAGDISTAASWQNIIYTKEQLFTWNSRRDPADASDAPVLGADIDMEMDPWTPRNFAGTFDGAGHKLFNINVVSNTYAGFLRELAGSASVKDLVVGSSDGAGYDGRSIISHSTSSNNYTWYYAGVVAKASGTSTVTGVTNFATVQVAADATSKTRIGGIVGNWNSTGALKDCTNYGTVQNLAATTGQASDSDASSASSIMGGVLGFFDVRAAVEECSNYGPVNTVNPGVSAVGGVVGYDGRGSTVKNCTNSGDVRHQAKTLVANTAVGGVIAYAEGASSTFGNIRGCSNSGSVQAYGSGKIMRMGGICGYIDYYLVSDSSNGGSISFSNSSATSGYLAIGGVAGHAYHGCVLTSCSNSAPVSSDKPEVNRIGGIAGTLNSSSARSCTNSGSVTLDNSSRAIINWESAGGIAGFAEGTSGTREITDCVNEGAVSLVTNSTGRDTPGRIAAGGITGMPYSSFLLSSNVNRGSVTVHNLHASAPYAWAGGIIGMDNGSEAGSPLNTNINYGSVKCVSGMSGYSGAGGLAGNLALASSLQGNCNFGDVEGTEAGAVAGVNACTFTATVCDALTVNGTAWGAASNKDTWACPQSSGTITLIVVGHTPDEDGSLPKPADPGNKVIAHRGGATECGYPDNSRAALRYAMGLGCYGSECDIYWTSDNNVIVAHADGNDQVNGLTPYEHTAAEIIAAKRLSNYEKIPTLEEYIDIVMEAGSKTKLILDIKMIDTPSLDYDHPAKAALRAIEIIQEKNAQNFCEFICTGYTGVMSKIASAVKASGIPCGWMNGDISAATFKSRGYTDWANLNTRDHFNLGADDAPDKGTGNRTITEYKNAGLQLSVFHLDKQSGNSSAVYTDATVQLYLDEYQYLRCITTNYPAWLLQKTRNL